jgi:hypothetical protein
MRLQPVYREVHAGLMGYRSQFEDELCDGRSLGFRLPDLAPNKTVVLEHLFVTCNHIDECQSSSRVMFRCVLDTLVRGEDRTEGLARELDRQRHALEKNRFNFLFLMNQGTDDVLLLNILLNEVPVAPVLKPAHAIHLVPFVKYRFDGETPEKLISLAFVLKNPGSKSIPIILTSGSFFSRDALRNISIHAM